MARLVAGGQDESGAHFRVIAAGTRRIIERREKDALGDLRWVTMLEIDLIGRHASVDRSAPALLAVLHVLDDVANARDAVAKTFDYSTGEGAARADT